MSDTKFRVVNLVEGSEYAFRVKAVNKVGESEPLEGTENIKMKSKWSKYLKKCHPKWLILMNDDIQGGTIPQINIVYYHFLGKII